MVDKIALAPCNGMSPNGLVSRVAVGDCRNENENVISICMGSTSADIDGRNDGMLRKYPIVAVNGCPNGCVNKILENKGIDVAGTVAFWNVWRLWIENDYFFSKRSLRHLLKLLPIFQERQYNPFFFLALEARLISCNVACRH